MSGSSARYQNVISFSDGPAEACDILPNRRSVLTLLVHEEDIAKLPTGLNRKKLSFQKLLEK